MGADASSMEFLRYIDLVVVFFLALFLALGIVLVRSERYVFKLMTTKSKEQKKSEGVRIPSGQMGSFRRSSSTTTAQMVTMEWDELSWEEKTALARRQRILNWASAVCGACGLMGAVWMGYAALHDIETSLGMSGIIVVALGFVCMGGYLVWNHLQLWRESASDAEVQMEGSKRDRSFNLLVLIFVLLFLTGGLLYGVPGVIAAVLISVVIAFFQRREAARAEDKDRDQ